MPLAGNPEVLNNLSQALHGLDLQGDIKRIAAATFPAAAGKDLNGACKARWGKEANVCYDELVSAIFSDTMA